jgi:hypothetical protein
MAERIVWNGPRGAMTLAIQNKIERPCQTILAPSLRDPINEHPEGYYVTPPRGKLEDAASLAGELRIARAYPGAVMPGPQRVLAEPAPERGATDLRDDDGG